ncbi:MAG: hypothetical protein R3293_18400 [Candidatus Promineifilaceae bacterium]|nr:hypothetical protein [Candidatus Promineifilaceae bacterium]
MEQFFSLAMLALGVGWVLVGWLPVPEHGRDAVYDPSGQIHNCIGLYVSDLFVAS